jgi:hypothetical protein
LGVGVSSSSITIAIIPSVRAAAGTRAAIWHDPNQLISRVCKCARQCRHDSPEISHTQFPTTLHVAISSSSYYSFESFPARSAPLQCQFPTESLSLIRRVRRLFHAIQSIISISLWCKFSNPSLISVDKIIYLSAHENSGNHLSLSLWTNNPARNPPWKQLQYCEIASYKQIGTSSSSHR